MFSPQRSSLPEPVPTLGSERSVSSRSRFGDASWYLDNQNPAVKHVVIHWTQPLLSGRSLGEAGNVSLLNACKEYIFLRLQGNGTLSKLKAATASRQALCLFHVCDWMLDSGIAAFGDIGQPEISQLRDLLKGRTGIWNPQARRFILDAKKVSNRRVEDTIEPLRGMAREREFLDDVPDWNPMLDPGRLEYERSKENEIPAIPDEISIPLFAEALRLVTEVGPELIAAKETIWKAYEEDFGRKRFSALGNPGIRFRTRIATENLSGSIVLKGKRISLNSLGRRKFTSTVLLLETACFIVIAGFTGMRISELSGIEIDCLEVRRSPSGASHLWIKSNVVKTAPDEPEPSAWIAGVDTADNPVRLAVEVATRITRFERDAYDLKALFITNASTFEKIKAPVAQTKRRDNRPGPMNVGAMNRRLNEFLAFMELDGSWYLTTHQFRKAFARFVARNHRMALLALKRHFKHMSLAMTELYHGTDMQLLELVSEERRLETEEALEEILGSAFLGGKLGEQIVKHNERFRGHAGAIARKSYVQALMNNGDVPLISTLIGFCFAFPDTARCGLETAKQGFEGCLPCPNLIIVMRHLPAWKERLEMMDRFRDQMILGGTWNDVRQTDWERRRNSTLGVIDGLEKRVPSQVDGKS